MDVNTKAESMDAENFYLRSKIYELEHLIVELLTTNEHLRESVSQTHGGSSRPNEVTRLA
jgi:hypothetical protein